VIRRLLNALLYFPARAIASAPDPPFEDVAFETADGEQLHAWWAPAQAPRLGHLLHCHGNGGNIGDRVAHIALLAAAGFDVLAFDYRGYGRSSGRPSEHGTYVDARAARDALLRRDAIDAARLSYLGESLGAAVAIELAREHPPAGLILQSPFTSVRDMARLHYPVIPRALVPDAYPSLRLIRELDVPLLVLHGERDEIVPPLHGEALYEAARGPKRLELLPGVGHNDVIARAGGRWIEAIRSFAASLS
jgi:uncharacterized protein